MRQAAGAGRGPIGRGRYVTAKDFEISGRGHQHSAHFIHNTTQYVVAQSSAMGTQRSRQTAAATAALIDNTGKALGRLAITRQRIEAVNECCRRGLGRRRGPLRAAAGKEEGCAARQGRSRQAHRLARRHVALHRPNQVDPR